MEYQIGDFSKISRLSVKTLRYYHEYGLLEPTRIDMNSSYRYYNEKSLIRARIINELKDLDFSMKEIKDILLNFTDDSEIIPYVTKKSQEIEEKLKKYKQIKKQLDILVQLEEENKMLNDNKEIVIKNIPDILIASIRFKGRYQEVGKAFSKLFKSFGSVYTGKPFSLYHDPDYREEDADIEACIPIKKELNKDGISCSILKGGEALSIVHQGPYDNIGNSYKVLIDYISKNNLTTKTPSREIYIKGPGIILPRNPKSFLTEIQILVN